MDSSPFMKVLGLPMSKPAKLALLYIVGWSLATGSCSPMYGMLANCVGVSTRGADNLLRDLKSKGFINVSRSKPSMTVISPNLNKISAAYARLEHQEE